MNNQIDIYNPEGKIIKTHIFSSNCVRKFSLMNEDSMTLRFHSPAVINFPVGSYVETPYGRFYITQEQPGKWNESTGIWNYELKFDAYYWLWVNRILRYTILNDKGDVISTSETSFVLTASIDIQARVIMNSLKALGFQYNESDFRVEITDSLLSGKAKLVRYENLSVLGGIQAIAEAFDCEWWVRENTIYFGKCENKDTSFTFKAGDNVSSISFQQAKSEIPNRLYVFGSTRNLPADYRKANGFDTIGGVVNKRLMLPSDKPYIQTDENLTEDQLVEQVVVLDDVYPKTELTVSEDPQTYTAPGKDESGNATSETFYRIKYGDSFPFSENYVLPGEELHIIFRSGNLNGMDFGVKFNPKGVNEKDTKGEINPEAQVFEIVANSDYGRSLPDDILKPQKGDEFILYGWDSTKIVDLGLIAEAEKELLEEGNKVLEEYSKDLTTCTCHTAWDYMKALLSKNEQPKPGDTVTIIDAAHFGTEGRKSRVIGYEYKLDKDYAEYIYTCGESISVKRLDSIEKKIEGLAKSGQNLQLQNSLDFLSKRYADRTPYSLGVGSLKTNNFVSGLFGGIGAGIDERGNGEFESLIVRSALTVMELIINRQSVMGGDSIFSEGGTVESCEFVADNGDGTQQWMLTLKEQYEGEVQEIQPGMVVRGVVNNLFEAANTSTPAKYYTSWMRVNGAELGTTGNKVSVTTYPDSMTPAGKNYPPCELMKLARWGHQTSETLQRLFYLSSHEGRLVRYEGVDKPIIDTGNIASLIGRAPDGMFDHIPGVESGEEIAYFKKILGNFIQIDYLGNPVAEIVDTGTFDPSRQYRHRAWIDDGTRYVIEDCWYCGCRWRCMSDGVTGIAPGYGKLQWGFVSGNPDFEVSFEETQVCYTESDISSFGAQLNIRARLYNQDVLPLIPAQNIAWSRESYDRNGALRAASDAAWVATTENGNKRLLLSGSDLDYDGTPISKIIFIATVALDDTTVQTIGAEFEI